MRLLLDSNAIARAMLGASSLSENASRAIREGSNEAYVSVATIYELEFKQAIGKLEFALPLAWKDDVELAGFEWLSINARHASGAARLPLLHRDPWDRMIVAQAIAEGLSIVTSDKRMESYGVSVIW